MKIITITLNPVFDRHYIMKDFILGEQNYAKSCSVFAGGKGINISSALYANGIESLPYIVMGKENSKAFEELLNGRVDNVRAFYSEGRIRENMIITDENGKETRLSENSFSFNSELIWNFYALLEKELCDNCIVAFSGRLPKGLEKRTVCEFLNKISLSGVYLAVDSNSFSATELISLRPWLIKPNDEEIFDLYGAKINTPDEAAVYAKRLNGEGIENVFITLGENGAAFCGKNFLVTANAPKIKPLSTVGAGDSTVAGFIGAFSKGKSLTECVKTAIAFGSAACLTEGTLPPSPDGVEKIYSQINIKSC